jgi:hypothetical protein
MYRHFNQFYYKILLASKTIASCKEIIEDLILSDRVSSNILQIQLKRPTIYILREFFIVYNIRTCSIEGKNSLHNRDILLIHAKKILKHKSTKSLFVCLRLRYSD